MKESRVVKHMTEKFVGHPVLVVTRMGSTRTGIVSCIVTAPIKLTKMVLDDDGMREVEEILSIESNAELVIDGDRFDRIAWHDIAEMELYQVGDLQAIHRV